MIGKLYKSWRISRIVKWDEEVILGLLVVILYIFIFFLNLVIIRDV